VALQKWGGVGAAIKGVIHVRRSSYVFRRPESGVWLFRWTVPASYRELFEYKEEIRHTLRTNNRD